MNFKEILEFDNHNLIVDLSDSKQSDINGFIALHNENLGPSLGGTRIFNYQSKADAIKDVLQLSRAMTYKCAIAGLPFGGGKGVIIADPSDPNIGEILNEYARQEKKLNGRFYTGEDVGLNEMQVQEMLKVSPYFIGKTGLAGDPSRFASMSAFLCIQVALKEVFGSSEISGRSFAVKGVGKTGSELAWLLAKSGGKVYINDLDTTKMTLLKKLNSNITILSAEELERKKVDVYAPCALGNDIDNKRIENLNVSIIAGTANNQLESAEIGDKLYSLGILHVPDYIANSGGLLNVADELLPGGYNKSRVIKNINNMKTVLKKVLSGSKSASISPDRVADMTAEKIFSKKRVPKKIVKKNS